MKDALEVYRRLGVPEVWICDGRCFSILVLQADRTYAEVSTSASLPMLTARADPEMGAAPPGRR